MGVSDIPRVGRNDGVALGSVSGTWGDSQAPYGMSARSGATWPEWVNLGVVWGGGGLTLSHTQYHYVKL